MARIDKLFRAKERQDNEFYTKYEDVQWYIEHGLSDYFRDKVIYCPCDTEQSNIVKYLKDNQLRLGIKEVLYTSDDYYGHIDLYEKADLVFTNPPFTKIRKWICFLDEHKYNFIIWFPMMSLYRLFTHNDAPNRYRFIGHDGCGSWGKGAQILTYKDQNKSCSYFTRPDGSEKGVVTLLISNDLSLNNFEYAGHSFEKTYEEIKDKLYYSNDILCCDTSGIIPNDYYELMYITGTAYIGRQKYFKFIKTDGVTCKDGKSRPRVLVKPIKEEIEKLKK